MLKLSKILFKIIIIAVVLVLTLLWLRENNLFMLNRVKIIGNNLLTNEEIIELADIDFSQEVFDLDTDAIRNRLLKNSLIKNVTVSRYLPSAVKIKVEERDLIANISSSKLSAIDIDGKIIKTKKVMAFYDLPIITGAYFKTDSAGNKIISPQMLEMINILKAIRTINFQLYYDISEINYNESYGIILYWRQKPIPIILGFDDYAQKICYLSTIYDFLYKKNELSTLKAIDVRFDGQVVIKD